MTPVYPLFAGRYRSVWLSDIHLGYKGCKAEYLLDFLRSVECERLYLVGDIVDIWSMKKSVHWPQQHSDVIRTILDKARSGVKVIYVPGNHDELLRDYHGRSFGNIRIRENCLHTTAAGKRMLVMHGDEFDSVIQCSKLAALIGTISYDLLLYCNRMLNHLRGRLGFPYWSLASFLKSRVKNAMQHVENFEKAAAYEAARHNADGVICGHIHHAAAREIDGVLYCNTGDWVESCTALVEHQDGRIELLHWSERKQCLTTVLPDNVAVDRKVA
ncbi:MAG: UDP-2,3-diacylglucosamine diphosphatase [Gammaproteobacteria bacterium]